MNKVITLLIASLFMVACSDSKNGQETVGNEMQVERYILNTHYKNVKEEVSAEKGINTVTEFFWYGCPHCETFEPHLEKWKSTIPSDVQLKQFPVVWNEPMDLHAKLFFIASNLERFEEIHPRLFKETMSIRGEKDLDIQKNHFSKVFAEYGMKEDDFMSQLSSFKVKSQVENSKKLMKLSGLTGTPAIMVNGKYVVISNSVKSQSEVMDIADFIVNIQRNAHNK